MRRQSHSAVCRPIRLILLAILLLSVLSGAGRTFADARLAGSTTTSVPRPTRAHGFFFIERHEGRTRESAPFLARSAGATVLLDGDGLAFVPNHGLARETIVRLSFGGLGPLSWEGRDPLAARASTFVGADPSAWRTGIPLFGAAVACDERTGVEVRLGGDEGWPAYAFRVPAGAPDGVPSLRFAGASGLEVDRHGNLAVVVPSGRWTHSAPRAFEETSRGRREVPCRFVLTGRDEVRVDVDRRDPAAALVVDPRVDFATTYGVPVWGEAGGVVSLDGQGRIAFAFTASAPVPSPYYGQPIASDVVVLRFDASGRRLLWSATIGSNGVDRLVGIVARNSGAVLVAGDTLLSTDFPRVHPVLDFAGFATDAFVCQVAPDGGSLEFSSVFGGTGYAYDDPSPYPGPMGDDRVGAVCVADDGSPVVVGSTDSIDLPVIGEFGRAMAGGFDAFVLRLAPDGRSVIHSGHLGGSAWDHAWGVAPGPDGSVYVVGDSESSDFPVLHPIDGVSGSSQDAFVTRLSAQGELTWSTRIGGSSPADTARAVAVAGDGTVYVAGRTSDPLDFPASGPGPFGPLGRFDLFVAHLDPDAPALLQSVVFGGSGFEDSPAACLDAAGRLWVTGLTPSSDFPVLDAVSADPGAAPSGYVPFLCVLSTDCDLVSSGYLGGSASGWGSSIAVGGVGLAWLGGRASTAGFPSVDAPAGTGLEAGNAYLLAAAFGPRRPQPVTAAAPAAGSATFAWGHDGEGVAGFVVERSDDGAPFQVIARPAADARSFAETNLLPGVAHVYRVRAVGASGDESRWSEEVNALSVPMTAPATPTGLSVELDVPGRVRLSWTDASDDEASFEIERTRPGEPAAVVATLPPGSSNWTDDAPAPDRTALYRVRARNAVGASFWSDFAAYTTSATLLVRISRGKIHRRGNSPRGVVVLHGSVVRTDGAPYDVEAEGLTVRLPGWDGPVLIDLPSGADGWKKRRGWVIWNSPRGASPRMKVTFAPASGRFGIVVTRVSPPQIEPGLLRICAGTATEGGSDERTWRRNRRTLVLR